MTQLSLSCQLTEAQLQHASKTWLNALKRELSALKVKLSALKIRFYSLCCSAYSEGATPKCLRKMVEKWARLEKPTV